MRDSSAAEHWTHNPGVGDATSSPATKYMKFISISMIKDECDIIELFIRINSRVIDHFFIVDNGSTDNTIKIIDNLKKEGFKITVYFDPNPDYQQSAIVTRALKSATNSVDFDWAFLLDADEFLNIPKLELEKELSTIPKNVVPALRWTPWFPKGDVYYNYDNPLWSAFEKNSAKADNFDQKIIVSKNMAKYLTIEVGNHRANYNGNKVNHQILKCGELDHVPVRSSSQIVLKMFLGSIKQKLKRNRGINESWHWSFASDFIKNKNYSIDGICLRYIAIMCYGVNTGFDNKIMKVVDEVDHEAKLGLETDVIKYKDLSRVNERITTFAFISTLADRIGKF